jgi:tetratricopeptide (TPR) repeat protein
MRTTASSCDDARVLSPARTSVIAVTVTLALGFVPGCKKKDVAEPEDDTWVPDESNEPQISPVATKSEEERTEEAKELFKMAEELAASEDWAGALPLYEQAYQLMPGKHGFALKVGDAAQKVGDCAKAMQYYDHFVKYAETDKYASDIRRAKKALAAGCK